jgi:hypothetical protein
MMTVPHAGPSLQLQPAAECCSGIGKQVRRVSARWVRPRAGHWTLEYFSCLTGFLSTSDPDSQCASTSTLTAVV